jgi:hypothetical protein
MMGDAPGALLGKLITALEAAPSRTWSWLIREYGARRAANDARSSMTSSWRRFTQAANTRSKNWSGATDIVGDSTARRLELPAPCALRKAR